MSKPIAWVVERAMSESRIEQCKPKKSACLSATPLYAHPDPRVAELEAVLRECREALVPYMKYVDGTSVLNHPAQCVAKIDEVLPE